MFLRAIRPHHVLQKVRVVSNSLPKETQTRAPKPTRTPKPIPTRLPKPNILNRFRVTGEVLVSKIFPAGFCWQGASVVAEQLDFATDSAAFALTTGTGDAFGVMAGHFLFYSLAKSTYLPQTNLKKEAQTALLLGTAAFGSGALWQPTVNLCHSLDLGFTSSLGVTGLVCGATFFTGLRLARSLYSSQLEHIEPTSKDNRIRDAQLSCSIGGGTGAFVGTDLGFTNNWMGNFFGISENMSIIKEMLSAGQSTTFGFCYVQTVQNILSNNNWTDS